MLKRLIDETEPEPISPLIDVVANAMAAMFIMLVVYMALTAQPEPPPIITISETDGLRFASGNAALSGESKRRLEQDLAPLIKQAAIACQCNVIEVIGHTDGQALRTMSNLDRRLDVRSLLSGDVVPGSNTDLGLLRAWSVIDSLRGLEGFAGMRFYGYSAGQTVLPGGALAAGIQSDEASRRRIEVRLRRLAISPESR